MKPTTVLIHSLEIVASVRRGSVDLEGVCE
jgi:hypothetical protein